MKQERPHHISAVAHHFLEEEAPTSGSIRVGCDYAVASPGVTPAAAFAAAGLLAGFQEILDEGERGADGRPVGELRLDESRAGLWSARSYLDEKQQRIQKATPSAGGSPLWSTDEDSWVLADGQPGRPRAGTPRLRVYHLGHASARELALRERWLAELGPECVVFPGRQGLVWCLVAAADGGLEPTARLGRLLALLQPRRLEILVFSVAWSRRGRPGWSVPASGPLPSESAADAEALERADRWVERLEIECPVCETLLGTPGDRPSRGGSGRALAGLARRLLDEGRDLLVE